MSIQGINVANSNGDSTIININNSVTNNTIQSGSDVSLSFFYDFPFTGLVVGESFIPKAWNFTGYSLGSTITGSGSFPSSGQFYQRSSANAKTPIIAWTYETGTLYKTSGGFSVALAAGNRVGIDISGLVSGLQNFTIGIFGF